MNGEIRDREIRVISETGEMLGVMSPREAMRLAEEAGLDLVKISPNAVPPVCKIMDWGKFKFEQAKKEKENRRNQKVVELKEVQLSVTIDVGDVKVKARKATEFLEEGNKVKVTIRLRGSQMAHAHLGRDVMMNFLRDAQGHCRHRKARQSGGAQSHHDLRARQKVTACSARRAADA